MRLSTIVVLALAVLAAVKVGPWAWDCLSGWADEQLEMRERVEAERQELWRSANVAEFELNGVKQSGESLIAAAENTEETLNDAFYRLLPAVEEIEGLHPSLNDLRGLLDRIRSRVASRDEDVNAGLDRVNQARDYVVRAGEQLREGDYYFADNLVGYGRERVEWARDKLERARGDVHQNSIGWNVDRFNAEAERLRALALELAEVAYPPDP